jgi:hypothetical protein
MVTSKAPLQLLRARQPTDPQPMTPPAAPELGRTAAINPVPWPTMPAPP